MRIFLGFDPGGNQRFGWCVATCDSGGLPLHVRAAGHACNALDAVMKTEEMIELGEQILGAGIDAPLSWPWKAGRVCDARLRAALQDRGAPSPSGSVQHVNSLRGACVAQGVLLALELRKRHRDLHLSESHPKAFLWLTVLGAPTGQQLTDFIEGTEDLGEHERDSAIACLSAWAAVEEPMGWQDLREMDPSCHYPVSATSYWMPQWT